jgi:uncharacterized peroxidase-related enzyme
MQTTKAMNRLQPLDPAEVDTITAHLFERAKDRKGNIWNTFRIMGHSPAALEGYLSLNHALGRGVLSPRIREQIALTVAEINGCSYCLSVHVLAGREAGLQPSEITSARRCAAADVKEDAAVKLARSIALRRGQVTAADLSTARGAGLDEAEMVEIILHVALNTLTNYVNNVAQTDLEFPEVQPGEFC